MVTTRSTYTDPQTKEYWLRVRAALKFCDGYSTEQLEGRTLGSLAKRLMSAEGELDEVLDYFDNRMDADCDETGFIPNEEMRMHQRVTDALTVIRSLSHFRQEQPDENAS